MAALGRQLTLAVARESVAASNLANLDTPGYKAQRVSFDEVLDQQMQGGLPVAVTQERHLPGTAGAPAGRQVADTEDLASRRDGNNVELDRELLSLKRASGDFAAAQTALAAKFRLVRYAISESR